MRVVGPPSRDLDPAAIVAPERFGEVAWGAFNASYERLQATPWWRINEGRAYGPGRRALRLVIAWLATRGDAFVDLRPKAAALAALPIPPDPDVVHYGAEVGWEAYLVGALFGERGRVVLVDADPVAFTRWERAARERSIPTPRGPRVVRRDAARTEYVRRDFFEWSEPGAFDVGVDWGLLEHFRGDRKRRVLTRFRDNLRPSGVQISAVPRDALAMRLFYGAFSDELNFGYRELLSGAELARVVEGAGLEVLAVLETPSTSIVAWRPRRGA